MTNIDKVMRSISYGMYIATTKYKGKDYGCVVNTLTQINSEDPLVSFAINKNNYTYKMIKKSKKLGFCILSRQSDPKVIGKFGFYSSGEVDKFSEFGKIDKFGLPFIVSKCCGYLACDVVDFSDANTHVLIKAKVTQGIYSNNSKLVPMTYGYYHDIIKGKAPKNAPTFSSNLQKEENKMDVSYICTVCGYVYEGDITKEPDSYVCPICGAGKEAFEKQED